MSYPLIKNEIYSLLKGINNKVSEYKNEITEFRDLSNVDFATPNSLSKRPGTESYLGATVTGRITGGVEYQKLNGASFIVVTANTNAYTVTPTNFSSIKSGLTNGAITDFVVFVDRLFVGNGAQFFVFDGSSTTDFSLPQGITGWSVAQASGGSLSVGVTAAFIAGYAYLDTTGSIGGLSNELTVTVDGTSNNSITYSGLTTPTGFGITAILLFRTAADGNILFGTTTVPVGTTTITDPGWPLSSIPANDNLYFTLTPSILELYNNQLFMAGFSSMSSTVYWSEIAEPRSVSVESFAEFRTEDGDKITGMKTYQGSLIVTKQRSIHRLTGTDPIDFTLSQISDQYGCLSNKALVVWENYLWVLSEAGIVQYNGANIDIVSKRIQPIIDRINIPAALQNAVAVHYRRRNQVWFAVPIDASSVNNVILVYDYLIDAWTKYDGLSPSTLFIAQGVKQNLVPFIGGYTGTLANTGEALTSDFGNAITCMITTHFTVARQQTIESQYRRFYLDVDPIVGFTAPVEINLRSNYGTSNVITRTMYQTPFQSRIDFGIPARSIQAQIVQQSATLGFKINGYTWASRFQRDS